MKSTVRVSALSRGELTPNSTKSAKMSALAGRSSPESATQTSVISSECQKSGSDRSVAKFARPTNLGGARPSQFSGLL
jgi:hypothetical protein